MHEPDHCSHAQVLKKLQAVWWSPYMTTRVDREQAICVHCPKYNVINSSIGSYSSPRRTIEASDHGLCGHAGQRSEQKIHVGGCL